MEAVATDRRGQAGVTNYLLAGTVAAVVALYVVVPVLNSGVASVALSSTAETIFGLVTLFVVLVLFVWFVSPMGQLYR